MSGGKRSRHRPNSEGNPELTQTDNGLAGCNVSHGLTSTHAKGAAAASKSWSSGITVRKETHQKRARLYAVKSLSRRVICVGRVATDVV
ncbi:hypothetical protein BAUCODRAFT_30267 [Baudoinia panamericana UAMH 10762]|uniref:Uncharacterized protein n=1 Tax=Baudoinia panamericana (strain UAMH 10762) TaxID=717646 RepID=M2LYS0_BAUPA|nr:uncharacterized protein BAUCODRAFT_30267 [Baudoinia panamericana UAMH 10762]EMC99852.1 hypothetical protein BAUCODRAFT_30267 [Baudoinia panamericana UAMH 10762]